MMSNSNKPVSEYTEIELKAFGFDILNQIENLNQNLSIINSELNRRRQDVKATVSQSQFENMQKNGEIVK